MTVELLTVAVPLLTGIAGVAGGVVVAWLRARARARHADADVERSRVIAAERRDVAALEHDARVAPVLADYLRSVDLRLAASDERHRDCERRAADCEERGAELARRLDAADARARALETAVTERARDVSTLARRLARVIPRDEVTGLHELRVIEHRPTPTPPAFPSPEDPTL